MPTMAHLFEAFCDGVRGANTILNALHTTTKIVIVLMTFLNSTGIDTAHLTTALKRISGVFKSLVTLSESIVAIINNITLVVNAMKEVVRVIGEWQHRWIQRWWVLSSLLWCVSQRVFITTTIANGFNRDQALRWPEERWHQEKHWGQKTTGGEAQWQWPLLQALDSSIQLSLQPFPISSDVLLTQTYIVGEDDSNGKFSM